MHRESNRSILDRMIRGAIWLAVMGLITSAAAGAILLCYTGLYQLCLKNILVAGTLILPGILLALASYMMARCGNDLIDR
jgi:hypothetical protein